MRFLKFVIAVVVLFSNFTRSSGQEVVYLDDISVRKHAWGNNLMILEDKTGKLKFGDIREAKYDSLFKLNDQLIPNNHSNTSSAYWIKFKINIPKYKVDNFFLIEIPDFKIDSLEAYIPLGKDQYKVYEGGDHYLFDEREFKHKNFSFNIPQLSEGNYDFYVRVKSKDMVAMFFNLFSLEGFTSYSNIEYTLLALFYGISLSMALCSIFLYVYMWERSYLFYSLYLISLVCYFLTRDGLGFQFLWPHHPVLNTVVRPVSLLCLVLFNLLYAQYYLSINNTIPWVKESFKIVIVFSLLLTLLNEFYFHVFDEPLLIAWFPFLYAYLVAIISMNKRNQGSIRLFLYGYTLLFIGFTVYVSRNIGVFNNNIWAYYSVNFGAAGEMLILSLAMANRIKQLMKEKDLLKDAINKELEDKVIERTKELEDRNTQLDAFVYKASHDIKGPLKSMIGLTMLGLKEVSDPVAREYFDHILKSTNKLDSMVTDLLKISKVKELQIVNTLIDFNKIIEEILSSFKHAPDFDQVKFVIHVSDSVVLYSDERLLYSVFQNMIENAVKYRDRNKERSFLDIHVKNLDGHVVIEFTDNGIGIKEELKERIFDMFYKIDNGSTSTGLGLYIVKISIDKLEGKIEMESKYKQGSVFRFIF